MSVERERFNEDTSIRLVQWKVKEIQVSGDIPSDTPEFAAWLEQLRRNDRRAKKIFGEYRITSHWMSGDGTILHVRLEKDENSAP